jgi:hypothetical protein
LTHAAEHSPRIHERIVKPRYGPLGAVAATLIAMALLPLLASASTSGTSAPTLPCPARAVGSPPADTAPFALSASTRQVGCIELSVTGAAAATVGISEVPTGSTGATLIANVSTSEGVASLERGVPWLCTRLSRTFQATETLADGSEQAATTTVTTPSCAQRLSVSIPSTRLHRGYPVTISVADRWHLGSLRVQACQPGVRPRYCPAVQLQPGHDASTLRLALRSAGSVDLDVFDAYESVHRPVHVLTARPLLLATGDSEMQVLDEILASELSGAGGAHVVGDAHQSTAISSPSFFNWPAHAIGQVAGLHPDIVAMFLGGNEGFELSGVECCGASWSRQYAVRVAGMMRLYLQHGAAAVYWFLIPTPSSEPFVRVVRAVDDGIVLAAREFHEGVHVLDLRPVFSPGGRYINSLTYDGHSITVHEPDGFHLSESSDLIVARLFIARLRKDGLLP